MSVDDASSLTSRPLLAILATVGPDGAPHATPVWYERDGDTFVVTSFLDRFKVRNIQRNPAVSLVIVDTAAEGEPVVVFGTAEVTQHGVREATERMAVRYRGEQGRAMLDHYMRRPRAVIRIRPTRVLVGEEARPVAWPPPADG